MLDEDSGVAKVYIYVQDAVSGRPTPGIRFQITQMTASETHGQIGVSDTDGIITVETKIGADITVKPLTAHPQLEITPKEASFPMNGAGQSVTFYTRTLALPDGPASPLAMLMPLALIVGVGYIAYRALKK